MATTIEQQKRTYRQLRSYRGGILSGGIAAGLFAGIVAGLCAMLASYAAGNGFWTLPRMCAAPLLGVRALVGGPSAVVVGLIAGLVSAAFWGFVFASLIRRDATQREALIAGVGFGICVWIVRTYGTLPLANHIMAERVALNPGWWFLQNLIYGACLYGTPALRRRYETRAEGRIVVEHEEITRTY
jgi:hypothetical protein